MTLATLLNRHIKASSLKTASAVAQATGGAVSAGYLYKLLRGEKQNPSGKVISTLIQVLQLPKPKSKELLQAAGLDTDAEVVAQVDAYYTILENPDIRDLANKAARLLELGHPDDVQLLIASAERFLNAYEPKDLGAIFNDPARSENTKTFLREANL